MHRNTFAAIAMTVVALIAIGTTVLAQPPAGAPPVAPKGDGKGPGGKGGPGGPGGPGGGFKGGKGGGAPAAPLPTEPTAVALPTISAKITGPGKMFDSGVAHWTGRGPDFYKYNVDEYFVSGTANGKPYTTRLVLRRPANDKKFSGLVMTEPMHSSGNAHGFGYNSIYIMTSGHIAAEMVTTGLAQFTAFNNERYSSLQMTGDQTNEVLAQVGALIRAKTGPLAGLAVRKQVLWGTSQSSQVVVNYLPAHMVYRTPEMARIYDGFQPTSNGGTIRAVDVPMIQIPTQNEFRNGGNITKRADGDAAGDQFRVYEWPGMGHLDARFDPRLVGACTQPLSAFPMEAYMSVALDHLFKWIDKGTLPPKAARIEYNGNDMVLDENGNPKGGIRSPYVDMAVVKYTAQATAAPGKTGDAPLLCSLSNWITPAAPEKLKAAYKDKKNYVKKFEARLKELEKAGWSLPVYHDLIMEDAKKVTF